MVGSHKVLTVSYGTFSCTLEGFEDPVDAMRGVAEFIRDLAAADRAFGAQAPVAAGIGTAPLTAPEAWPVEAWPADAAAAAAPAGFDLTAAATDEATAWPEPSPPMLDLGDPALAEADDLVAKLRRIRAVVGSGPATPISEDEFAPAPDAPHGSALWPEDEGAAPPAEAADDFADEFAEDAPDAGDGRPALRLLGDAEGEDAAVERLLSRADAQLADPEGSRRRESLAQLRAAVAATESDPQDDTPDEAEADPEEAFRDDLRQAVRPRRTLPTGEASRARPAPLRLVAAQRVDLAAALPGAPVLPRRVAADVPVDAAAFAAFAAAAGADTLPDLVEAAAAHAAFVEGRAEFSRLEVLAKAREARPDAFRREDGLRAWDSLVDRGAVSPAEGGRFRAGPGLRFNPVPPAEAG